jgi:asparaginyl-tRNA synthetase
MDHIDRPRIVLLRETPPSDQTVEVFAWVRTKRDSKTLCFFELNDGSSLKGLQAVIDKEQHDLQGEIDRMQTGCSVRVRGRLVESPARGRQSNSRVPNSR